MSRCSTRCVSMSFRHILCGAATGLRVDRFTRTALHLPDATILRSLARRYDDREALCQYLRSGGTSDVMLVQVDCESEIDMLFRESAPALLWRERPEHAVAVHSICYRFFAVCAVGVPPL
ncbi:MAG: hypothetical protein SGPRY_003019 [Prymnesium sp.]